MILIFTLSFSVTDQNLIDNNTANNNNAAVNGELPDAWNNFWAMYFSSSLL